MQRRNRQHDYGFSTETVSTGFRLQETSGTTEMCGTVTVEAADEGSDGGDTGDDGGDTGGDGGDTGGDGGDTGGDDSGASTATVPDSVPIVGGRPYDDPTVLALGLGTGVILYGATND